MPGLGPGLPSPTPGRDRWARVPAAFGRKVTTETGPAPLTILDGQLPGDLAGHVLFQSLSLGAADTGFGGDALVWRVDFDGAVPTITSRLLRTTDYLLGEAFAGTRYAFEPHGMMRMGPLGIQDQANTALVRMNGNRVLATVDAGRSWELDPATLRPITPVGRLTDYRPMVEFTDFDRFLCPLTITSAHPPYDPRTGEYHGVSLSTLPLPGTFYSELVLWDGSGEMKRVPVSTPDLQPLLISQSAHQICLCRDYVVIIDAAATIEFGKLFNPPTSYEAGVQTTPRPDSWVWIIDRRDLRSTTGGVIAHPAVIPRETGHFFLDYEHPPGRIVVHDAHTSATDFAEWLMPWDVHPATGRQVRSELAGTASTTAYDLGVVGRYEIDVATGRIVDQHAFAEDWTWGCGGLTTRNPRTPDDTLGSIFHANAGFPTDLAVDRVYQGFRSYPHRIVPTDDLPWAGVPTSLVRVDHDAGRVADGYWFPGDVLAWTPTFVPRRGTATGSTDGYVVSVVFSDHATAGSAGTELWVFDATDLAAGPLARLGRADLEVPITLHSLWLDSLTVDRPDYEVDVEAELLQRARTWALDPDIEAIVRSDVIPAWRAARA